jgi:hypothetical protein
MNRRAALVHQQLRVHAAVLHEHGQRIQHAEGGGGVVPAPDVGDRAGVVGEQFVSAAMAVAHILRRPPLLLAPRDAAGGLGIEAQLSPHQPPCVAGAQKNHLRGQKLLDMATQCRHDGDVM